ncbi:MAG TPA: ribose-phosphate pyrophosphokinase [Syntrophorhabdaceae bacterium]|nr:Ribose-phosphate pyrophosphokinase [Syntrophorhabdaceae bacterium]HNQ63773.1 ribose-phosphate pyrophosphokinase [Syntrophorhabdaceae bacterium]HNZ58452.1 ribose-phosphate pyrophosphokinase [Syntrophorhabdaceae bacterium]HOG40118.1 ribose-phosphate pyrophosphokinase [Syntrophorhabdaceae bacterium]HQJ94373.1 ribose-phosphate pyrophosphokinase [Syntrophorhabdaceae bacterium]
MDKLRIFSGNANRELAERMCKFLNVELGNAKVSKFSDGEIQVEIEESVRGMDTFLVQPTCPPVSHNLMEVLVMVDALKRASAARITVVIPYYGYARQDRKVVPRTSISARLVANLITIAGASRVLAMDLHAGQIQGFFDIPVDHLYALPVQLEYLRGINGEIVVVSPDAGGVERARELGKRMNASLAIIDKRRVKANVSKVMHIVGNVENKTAIILDDMIDTGGTIVQAADAIINNGAKAVYACCTHPVLSGNAVEKIANSSLTELIVTNTIPLSEAAKKVSKIKVLDVSPILGEAIKRIYRDESVSSLFV